MITNPYSPGNVIRLARARKDFKGGAGDIGSEVFCRGFSIDALAVSLNTTDFGNIVDVAGGLFDIELGDQGRLEGTCSPKSLYF